MISQLISGSDWSSGQHQGCLVGWLSSVPSQVTSLVNQLIGSIGACPSIHDCEPKNREMTQILMQQITSYQTKKADFVLSSSFSLYFKPSILNNTGPQALKQVALLTKQRLAIHLILFWFLLNPKV